MTRRELRVVLFCGLAAAVMLVVRFVVLPGWEGLARSLSAKPLLEEQRAQYARVLAGAGSVDERLAAGTAALKRLQERFFTESDGRQAAVSLLRHVEGLAADAGVAVQSKDVLGTSTRQGLEWVTVSLTVECTSPQLTRLLYSIGHDRRHLTLDALEVRRNEATPSLRSRLDIASALLLAAGGERP
jgi:hypothetical protein